MLKKMVILFIAITIMLWFQVVTFYRPFYCFVFLPIAFLAALNFFLRRNYLTVGVIVVLGLVQISVGIAQTFDLFFLTIPLVGIVLSIVVFFYFGMWQKRVLEFCDKKESAAKDAQVLKDRFQARLESLNYLERQVGGLVKLFEMARDLNESLSFPDLLNVVNEKMSREANFFRGSIIILGTTSQDSKAVENVFQFGGPKRENQEELQQFAESCVGLVKNARDAIRIESEFQSQEESVKFHDVKMPLWLFPFSVEHQLIAVMTIEGAVSQDFPKFEILASQLTLQVKKIRLYETVRELSIIDGLTQTFVRRHFLDRFQEELRRAIRYRFPLSVLMVDVDHFKSYNDDFGHLVGDKALREIAQVIRENIRKVDFIGRFGGEEFIIVAPEIEKQKASELVAERIRSAVARKKLSIYENELQATISIGIAAFPDDLGASNIQDYSEEYVDELIQKADRALYRAKEEGRNRVVVYQ